ncbi:MAG: LuxR C-terminal-related transcriptional regulator [Pseudomonadota bacterium]
MNILLCSSNEGILSRWQESLSSLYDNIVLCSKDNALKDVIKKHTIEELKQYVILYHLSPDLIEEKALYHFLSEHPIAKQMLVLVNSPENEQGIRILFSGIHGYANVYLNTEKLKAAVKVLEQGEIWAGEEILIQLLNRHPNTTTEYRKDKNLKEILSNREKQIVDQVLKGKTNKDIGMELNITERTVKAHLTTIYKKTATRNRFELNVKLQAM